MLSLVKLIINILIISIASKAIFAFKDDSSYYKDQDFNDLTLYDTMSKFRRACSKLFDSFPNFVSFSPYSFTPLTSSSSLNPMILLSSHPWETLIHPLSSLSHSQLKPLVNNLMDSFVNNNGLSPILSSLITPVAGPVIGPMMGSMMAPMLTQTIPFYPSRQQSGQPSGNALFNNLLLSSLLKDSHMKKK